MATELKLRRGTTSQHSTFTGAEAEVTVDTDKETVVVHDGATVGGYPVAREDMSNVPNDTISGDQIAGGDATFDSINVDSGTLFVDSSGNVGIGTTSPSEKLEVNGNIIADGVYLGGTGTANYLDDYEEGTWTPGFGSVSSPSYTIRSGRYVKVGRVVYVSGKIDVSSIDTSDNSAVTITGLPFIVEDSGHGTVYREFGETNLINTSFGTRAGGIFAVPNVLNIADLARSSFSAVIRYTDCNTSGSISFSATYEADS